MNVLEGTALALGGIAALLLLLALVLALPRILRSGREWTAQGMITGLQRGTKGARPVVRFVAGSGQPFTFTSGERDWRHRIGQQLVVYYDPHNPDGSASLLSPRQAYLRAALMTGVALLLLPVAAALAFWFAPLERAHDDAYLKFLAAVRSGDPHAVQAQAAPNPVFDPIYLQHYVRTSTGFEETRESSFGSRSCVAGTLQPHRVPLVMGLVKIDGVWKVRTVARNADLCNAIRD